MKLTKTQWIIVAVVAAIAIWYLFLRKKPTESGYTRACNASTTNACGRNMVCVNGRCEFASGSHW